MTPFHVLVDGSCWVSLGKLDPIRVHAGEVIVFPRADQHVMASDIGLPPVPIRQIFAQPSREEITRLRYGGPGRPIRFICGYLHADHQFDPMLNCLPSLLCVRSRGAQSRSKHGTRQDGAFMRSSIGRRPSGGRPHSAI